MEPPQEALRNADPSGGGCTAVGTPVGDISDRPLLPAVVERGGSILPQVGIRGAPDTLIKGLLSPPPGIRLQPRSRTGHLIQLSMQIEGFSCSGRTPHWGPLCAWPPRPAQTAAARAQLGHSSALFGCLPQPSPRLLSQTALGSFLF